MNENTTTSPTRMEAARTDSKRPIPGGVASIHMAMAGAWGVALSIGGVGVAVYGLVISHSNAWHGGGVTASISTMARSLFVGTSAVRRALRSLRAVGLITYEDERGGRSRTYRITVTTDPAAIANAVPAAKAAFESRSKRMQAVRRAPNPLDSADGVSRSETLTPAWANPLTLVAQTPSPACANPSVLTESRTPITQRTPATPTAAPPDEDRSAAMALLLDVGVDRPVAERLAVKHGRDRVAAARAWADERRRDNPPGFVITALTKPALQEKLAKRAAVERAKRAEAAVRKSERTNERAMREFVARLPDEERRRLFPALIEEVCAANPSVSAAHRRHLACELERMNWSALDGGAAPPPDLVGKLYRLAA